MIVIVFSRFGNWINYITNSSASWEMPITNFNCFNSFWITNPQITHLWRPPSRPRPFYASFWKGSWFRLRWGARRSTQMRREPLRLCRGSRPIGSARPLEGRPSALRWSAGCLWRRLLRWTRQIRFRGEIKEETWPNQRWLIMWKMVRLRLRLIFSKA